ncbi:MAG: DUF3369 domain-containing protein [Roseibium sp.]
MDDLFEFAPENTAPGEDNNLSKSTWKIAIVDDDEDVHTITQLALAGFEFEGRSIEYVHAYSGLEAKKLFKFHDDIALVLLDVVMEDDHAGLDVADFIRNSLGNTFTRIVLRTGQPGQAPEKEVIRDYDINDYKEKTELTSQKLYTLIYSSLRSYRDIIALDKAKGGLAKVIEASKHVLEKRFVDDFATGVLEQITSVLHTDQDALLGELIGLAAKEDEKGVHVVAGIGRYSNFCGQDVASFLPPKVAEQLLSSGEGNFQFDDKYLAVRLGLDDNRKVILLQGVQGLTPMDRHLLDIFVSNMLIAFDNLTLHEEILETQREVVYRLGEAVETRSRETGNHVKRVAKISKIIAKNSGMSKRDIEILKHASPLHDLGKIAIPDSILNKPGKLDAEEWELMQTHTDVGYHMLADSRREILRVGAMISKEHHEKWDGTGYPNGLAGEDISIEARITAIADVYDALASDRCYKKAWPLDKIDDLFREESGRHFDPELVKILFENIEEIRQVRDKYVDA